MKKSIAGIMIVLTLLIISFLLVPQTRSSIAQISPNDYPSIWANQPKDSMLDSWDFPNRECTSYIGWKVFETYHIQLRDWGVAYQWDFQARARGYNVDTTPAVNSVAVDTSFKPGHVMWIEKINADGSFQVSEYNHDNQGNFDYRTISHTVMTIIHFN